MTDENEGGTAEGSSQPNPELEEKAVCLLTGESGPQSQETAPLGLLEWARLYLPDYIHRDYSGMHRWLAERLDASRERRGLRLNVVGPRGSAKSTIVTLAHVLRAALEKWEPYIWIISDTRPQASLHLENVKTELVENKNLEHGYPDGVGKGLIWRAGTIRLKNGVAVEAFGTGQGIRGRRMGAHRPTLIVCDDIENDRHAISAWLRDRSRRWFFGAVLKAGKHETNILHLATALHREALAPHLARTGGWTSRTFAAIERWPENMALWETWEKLYADVDCADSQAAAREFYEQHRATMDAGAELLWPQEEDLYSLMCLRASGGRAAFEREKQGVPVNPEMCEFDESWFGSNVWFDEWPRAFRVRVLALDPSKGREDRHGDYSAFVFVGVDAQGTAWVEADLARRPTPEIVATGAELIRRLRPDVFGLETNQFQELLGAHFMEELRRQGILWVVPMGVENRTNKRVRIRWLGQFLAERKLRFLAGSAGTKLLVDQLKDFPVADHDDGPDALEMALRLAFEHNEGARFDDGLGDRLVW
jgi:predicted phage terminase large subunit-like protein